jgi:hypothetical protein
MPTKMVFIILLLTLLTLFFNGNLAFINFVRAISTNGEIIIPFSAESPTIDGKWTTENEWIDSAKITIEKENHKVNIWIKHSEKYLFVLLDFITDFTSSTFDQAGICLDTYDDGGSLPKKDDYLFNLRGSIGSIEVFQGTGVGEKPEDAWRASPVLFNTTGAKGYEGVNNPDEKRDHRIYEFQIGMGWFLETTHYGFYAFLCDWHSNYSFLEWPKDAGGKWESPTIPVATQVPPAPQNWGSIKNHFVHEKFDLTLLVITVMLVVVLMFKLKTWLKW